ncbi:MAG: hypothetical protein RSB67_04435 [Clostridia bacterium]
MSLNDIIEILDIGLKDDIKDVLEEYKIKYNHINNPDRLKIYSRILHEGAYYTMSREGMNCIKYFGGKYPRSDIDG